MSDREITQSNLDLVNEAGDAASNMASISANPTGVSRSELMAKLVSYATMADKEELADFVASIGGEAAPNAEVPDNDTLADTVKAAGTGVGDMSAKNMASIKSTGKHADPMPSMKEDLALVFGESSDLSEDFQLRVSTLFEAAVSTRVNLEVAQIQENNEAYQNELAESYQQTLEESINNIKEEMVENVDNYLNYAVAEWISENKLAIENNIRTQIAESFMASLKNVFDEHYVEIPDDQVSVVEAMAEEIEQMKAKLNQVTEANIQLSKAVNEMEVSEITNTVSERMTDTQKEKFGKLVEAINYSDVNEFRKKISIIKETYFPNNIVSEVRVAEDQLLSESVEEPEKTPYIDPSMQAYVSTISRSVNK